MRNAGFSCDRETSRIVKGETCVLIQFYLRNLRIINFQAVFEKSATNTDLFSSLSLPIISEMMLLKIFRWRFDAVLQTALSRQAFCRDNSVVSRSLSFASRRNRAPYHCRTSGQTMAADNGSGSIDDNGFCRIL